MVKSQDICCAYSTRSSAFNLVRNHAIVLPLALERSSSRSLPWSGCARGEAGKAWLISELGRHNWHIPANSICILFWNHRSTTQKEWPEMGKYVCLFVCLFKIMNLSGFCLFCFFSRHLQYFSFHSKVYKNKFFPYWASQYLHLRNRDFNKTVARLKHPKVIRIANSPWFQSVWKA